MLPKKTLLDLIHKFQENARRDLPDSLDDVLGDLPVFVRRDW